MDIGSVGVMVGTILTALGGFEFVKWIFNRKTNSRITEANADSAELKNERDEFHFLRERLEFKDQEIIEKETRFAEQTAIVRDLNKQLLSAIIENGKLQAAISTLEAERKMKLCERRNCVSREPQSGY